MLKSLLISAAALGLALPAMAQNTSNGQTTPSPDAGVSQPMSSDQGDMTGMHPMRHPRGGRMAQHHGRMRHGGPTGGAMDDTGARPGHEPGVGESEPASNSASNIDRGNTRGDIAPRLPNPDANGNSAEAYLAAADRALARRQTGAAQEALERAETRMLDRSVPMGAGNMPAQDPRIMQVNGALQALANRNYAGARQNIQQAMNMRGGMGETTGQPGMQPGMDHDKMMGEPGAGHPR